MTSDGVLRIGTRRRTLTRTLALGVGAPAGASRLSRGLRTLLRGHLFRSRLPTLQAPSSPESDGGRILSIVRIKRLGITRCLVHDLTGKLVGVYRALARAVRHRPDHSIPEQGLRCYSDDDDDTDDGNAYRKDQRDDP